MIEEKKQKKGIKPSAVFNEKGILRHYFADYGDAEEYADRYGWTVHQFRNMDELLAHVKSLEAEG